MFERFERKTPFVAFVAFVAFTMALQVSAAAASIAVTRAIGSWLARSCRWGQPPSPIWWRIGRMKWLFSKPPESTLAYRKVEFDVDWILQCVLDAAPFFMKTMLK